MTGICFSLKSFYKGYICTISLIREDLELDPEWILIQTQMF